jgi:hypothetical protein
LRWSPELPKHTLHGHRLQAVFVAAGCDCGLHSKAMSAPLTHYATILDEPSAGLAFHASGLADEEPDDDAGDDGREGAVDEDKLRAEEEDDIEGDESSLNTDEALDIREKLS